MKRGRAKYKRQKVRQKIYGWKYILGSELGRRRSIHTVGKLLTCVSVGSFGISEGNITRKKTKTWNKHPNVAASREVAKTYRGNQNKQRRWNHAGSNRCNRLKQCI